MPSAAAHVLLAAPLLAACGGSVVFDEAGGDGGAAATTSSPSGAGGEGEHTSSVDATTVGAGPGSTSGITTSAGATVGASTTTAAGGGAADLFPEVLEALLTGDCMPAVGPDPLRGSMLVRYRNNGARAGSLDALRADAIFANDVEGWVFPLALEPTSSGPVEPGAVVDLEHLKVETPGDSSFVCSFCGAEGVVVLHWIDAAGDEVVSDAPFTLACAL